MGHGLCAPDFATVHQIQLGAGLNEYILVIRTTNKY